MRKSIVLTLLLFWSALAFAQPSLLVPAKTTSTFLTTKQPTFKWSQVAGATEYELYFTANVADTTFANSQSVPNAATVNTVNNFVVFGSASTDTTYTVLDTVLQKNTEYYWKIRARVAGSWTPWAYPYSYFKIGAPNYTMSNGYALIAFNHDTSGAITSVRYLQGSGQQILDSAYNTTNLLGIGGNGAQKDTIITWYTSANTDTNIFTYQNALKYGPTGSKVMTVYAGPDGITANISLTLEKTKAVKIGTAWTPGGGASGTTDNVLLVKRAAAKTSLTYPGTPAPFGPDSVTLSAMYDSRYDEYSGFKSSSLVAVADTQETGLLEQVLSFSNTSGSNKTFSYGFAVRHSRLDYFNAWAGSRALFVLRPAAGATLTSTSNYIVWESFGASPASISFSNDGGTTFGSTSTITADTTSVDSAQYVMPYGPMHSNCVVEVTSTQNDVAQSGQFTLNAPGAGITYPTTGDSIGVAQHEVVWTNSVGASITSVDYSLDGGTTWTGKVTINPASTAATDSALVDFYGAKTVTHNAAVRIYGPVDTVQSGFFTIGKGGAVFSVPSNYGTPGNLVTVLVKAKDYVVGDSIKSLDLQMSFDSSFVHFDSLQYTTLFQNNHWIYVHVDSPTYVRMAAFMAQDPYGVTDDTIATLYFTVGNNQSNIGESTSLGIKNSVLAASGNNAYSLDVSGSTDGVLKIYSSISGHLHYLHEDTITASYNISGDSLIVYHDFTDATNNGYFDVVNGQFNLTNRAPSDNIAFYPSASVYTATGWSSINVTDAQLAFKDFYHPLSTRAKLAADVNGDSVVNTTDAEMIVDISVDSTFLKRIGLSNWIFIDSTNLASIEHASDSLTEWWKAEKDSISCLLSNQLTKQDFFGVLRGDVDFSYGASQDVNTSKSLRSKALNPVKEIASASSIVFSTNANVDVGTGDTIWIPLNINPGDTVIGGFNASIQVSPNVASYTGQFKMGDAMPQKSNWYVAAKSDTNGNLRVAATDFSIAISPIASNGTALQFQYIVNKDVKVGSSCPINVQTQTVIDPNLHRLQSVTQNGQIEVSGVGSDVVTQYELSQNFPNPFNPSTTIRFALPMDSKVDIVIYNVLGQKVATLVNGATVSAGYHDVVWNASNFSSGVYFSVMKCSSISTGQNFRSVKKLMLIK